MVHGGKDVVNGLLDHEDIEGINFVGSTPVAKYVYQKVLTTVKEFQALGGAKNFIVMLPDAPIEQSVAAMVDSCLGCAGERCLAGSVLVGVGEAYDKLKAQVLKEVGQVVVGNGLDPKTTLGPVISAEAKVRIEKDIETALSEGAELLDGRNPKTETEVFPGFNCFR